MGSGPSHGKNCGSFATVLLTKSVNSRLTISVSGANVLFLVGPAPVGLRSSACSPASFAYARTPIEGDNLCHSLTRIVLMMTSIVTLTPAINCQHWTIISYPQADLRASPVCSIIYARSARVNRMALIGHWPVAWSLDRPPPSPLASGLAGALPPPPGGRVAGASTPLDRRLNGLEFL